VKLKINGLTGPAIGRLITDWLRYINAVVAAGNVNAKKG
jgi:hypothetical protein